MKTDATNDSYAKTFSHTRFGIFKKSNE